MTVNEFIKELGQHQHIVLAYFAAIPLLSLIIMPFYKRKARNGFADYLYSTLIYMVAVPGMFSISLLVYVMLMLRGNILNVDIVVYFVPLISMILVFYLISRKTSLTRLPGFGKIISLLIMLAIVFMTIFFLSRLHFVVGFFGSINHLLFIALVMFIIFRIAAWSMFRKKNR